MLRKFFSLLMVIVLAVLMANCSSDKFVIEGNLANGGTQNILIVYPSADGVQYVWLPMAEGKFVFEGSSQEPVVAYIYNQQHKFMAHVMVENGDKVKIEGDYAKPLEAHIKGTDANEDWNKFISSHAKIFENGNSSMIDLEIEKYIRENKDNVVSALLLFNDYSNLTDSLKVKKLMEQINHEAYPQSIVSGYQMMRDEMNTAAAKKVVSSMILYSDRDSMEVLAPSNAKTNIFYFWSSDDNLRPMIVDRLSTLYDDHRSDKRLQVADITLDNDTASWHRELKNSKAPWRSFWAIGGTTCGAISDLKIMETPLFIVTDSVGHQLYRGKAVDEAVKRAKSIIPTNK